MHVTWLNCMVGILYFYDVPVYRVPEACFYAERDRYIDITMFGTLPDEREFRKAFYERNADTRINLEDRLEKTFGGPWCFNEIVGYVRLHFLGSQVRGALWMVDRKRIVKSRTKLILPQSHKVVYEEDIPFGASNEQVFQVIQRWPHAVGQFFRIVKWNSAG